MRSSKPGTSSHCSGSKISLTPSIALMTSRVGGRGMLVRGNRLCRAWHSQEPTSPASSSGCATRSRPTRRPTARTANTLRDSGDPIVVITSVGAKSGNLRKNPVMRVERDGAYVAIASKGGAPDNPEWYHNFVAHPEVELQDGAEKHTYRARLADRRRAHRVVGLRGRDLADVRRVPEEDRPRDPGLPARADGLTRPTTNPSTTARSTRPGPPGDRGGRARSRGTRARLAGRWRRRACDRPGRRRRGRRR